MFHTASTSTTTVSSRLLYYHQQQHSILLQRQSSLSNVATGFSEALAVGLQNSIMAPMPLSVECTKKEDRARRVESTATGKTSLTSRHLCPLWKQKSTPIFVIMWGFRSFPSKVGIAVLCAQWGTRCWLKKI